MRAVRPRPLRAGEEGSLVGSWRHHGVVGSWGRGVVGSWGRGVVGSWGRGVVGSWGRGVVGSWGRGVVGSWAWSWGHGVVGGKGKDSKPKGCTEQLPFRPKKDKANSQAIGTLSAAIEFLARQGANGLDMDPEPGETRRMSHLGP